MKKSDLSLYVVLDLPRAGKNAVRLVSAVLRGGATILQLRDKRPVTMPLMRLARGIRPWLNEKGVLLIINDRVGLALDCGADGVHVGQQDLDPREARAMAEREGKPHFAIGVSVSTVEEARKAVAARADYLSVSPLFGTATKTDLVRPAGLEGLRSIRVELPLVPIVAIGGIQAANAGDVIRAGADGVAVISAVISAIRPELTTRRIAAAVAEAKKTKEKGEHHEETRGIDDRRI